MFGTVLLCAGLTSPACTGNVKRGHALYSEGYYVEAAEVFERNERRLSEWPPDKRAAYGLYRGMTLLELGDLRGAGRWLAYARWVAGEHPGVLPAQEQALLAQSQRTLDARLGRPGLDGSSPVIATTGGPPSPPGPASTPGAKKPPETRKSFGE